MCECMGLLWLTQGYVVEYDMNESSVSYDKIYCVHKWQSLTKSKSDLHSTMDARLLLSKQTDVSRSSLNHEFHSVDKSKLKKTNYS